MRIPYKLDAVSSYILNKTYGTTGCQYFGQVMMLHRIFGIDPNNTGASNAVVVDGEELKGNGISIAAHQTVFSSLADQQSLRKMEDDGELHFLPEDWNLRPPGPGAGADARVGRAQIRSHRKSLESRISTGMLSWKSFERRRDNANGQAGDQLMSQDCWTAVGGTGTAASYESPLITAHCANVHGVPVRQEANVFLLGSLYHRDLPRANLNQTVKLKDEYAISTGMSVDPITGQRVTPHLQQINFYSNENSAGNDENLDDVINNAAMLNFSLMATRIGAAYRRRIVDIQGKNATNEYGERLNNTTGRLSVLRLDKQPMLDSSSFALAADLISSMLLPIDVPQEKTVCEARLSALEFNEGGDLCQISRSISKPLDLGGINAGERVNAVYTERAGKSFGTSGFHRRHKTIGFLCSDYIPHTIASAIQQEAGRLSRRITSGISDDLNERSMSMDGLQKARLYLEILADKCERNRRAIDVRLAELQQQKQTPEKSIGKAAHHCEALKRGNWFLRLFRRIVLFFLARSLNAVLDREGPRLLSLLVQIEAMKAAQRLVLNPVKVLLDEETAKLGARFRKLPTTHDAMHKLHKQFANQKDKLLCPSGKHLADDAYIERFVEGYCRKHGGRAKVGEIAFSELTKQHGSLNGLLDRPVEELPELFAEPFRRAMHADVAALSVVNVFMEQYPDEHSQISQIAQCVRESRGAIATFGEANKHITWINLVGVPSDTEGQPIVALLNKIEGPGVWVPVVTGDSTGIYFVGIRGEISIGDIIVRANLEGPEHWSKLLEQAPNGVTAVIPPRPTPSDVRWLYAMLIAMDRIKYEKVTGFQLVGPSAQPIPLGHTAQEAAQTLAHNCPWVVWTVTSFARRLVVDYDRTMEAVNSLMESLQDNAPATNKLLELTDIKAVELAQHLITLWMPRLRRIKPKNIDRSEIAA